MVVALDERESTAVCPELGAMNHIKPSRVICYYSIWLCKLELLDSGLHDEQTEHI